MGLHEAMSAKLSAPAAALPSCLCSQPPRKNGSKPESSAVAPHPRHPTMLFPEAPAQLPCPAAHPQGSRAGGLPADPPALSNLWAFLPAVLPAFPGLGPQPSPPPLRGWQTLQHPLPHSPGKDRGPALVCELAPGEPRALSECLSIDLMTLVQPWGAGGVAGVEALGRTPRPAQN